MASFLGSIFGFEFGTKIYLFWRLWQVIPDWLVLDATGCEQSELLLLCCGSTSMIPTASLWNKSLATGCSMMVYPWVDTCCLEGASRRCSGTCQHDTEKTVYDLRFWHDDAWRESRASLVEEWNFMLDIRLGCESICKRVVGHIHWEFFFLAPQHFFSFWTVCVSFDRGHF